MDKEKEGKFLTFINAQLRIQDWAFCIINQFAAPKKREGSSCEWSGSNTDDMKIN